MSIAVFLLGLLGTVAAHEAGHAIAAEALGLPWTPALSWRGPGIRVGSDSLRLSRAQIAITAAAGPFVSLVLAAALWPVSPLLALASLELAFWNLVLPRSDGATVVRALRGKATA